MRYLLRSLRFQFLNRHLTRRISTETRHKRHVSFFIKVNQYLFYNFAASNQPYITMLNGHGDDSYRYGRKITLNFSSNVYHHTSLAPLFRHLENCWEQVRSYPEPSPHAVESQLAQAMGISAESVCLTSGATEAIYLIAQTFPDGVPASCPPRFRNTADACRLHGHQVRSIYTTDHLPEDADIVWICNPNNPTSSAISTADMKKLLTVCRSLGIFVMIDETYIEFAPESTSLSAVSLVPEFDNFMVIRGVSKFFAALTSLWLWSHQ